MKRLIYIKCESVTAMKEKVGEVFSIVKDNQPVTGCTISKEVHSGGNYIIYFSLAKNTDISAEIYPYHKLIVIVDGSLDVYGIDGCQRQLAEGEAVLTPTDTPIGMKTAESAVYTEISIRSDDRMNDSIKAGEVFKLAELVPYVEGKVVNMDVVHNDKMKFVVMAFDEGTCPEVFSMSNAGIAVAIEAEVPEGALDSAAEAKNGCPVGVIDENIRSQWNSEENDLAGIPALVTGLIVKAEETV